MPVEAAPYRAGDRRVAVRLLEMDRDLLERDVVLRRHQGEDFRGTRFETTGPPVATLSGGCK